MHCPLCATEMIDTRVSMLKLTALVGQQSHLTKRVNHACICNNLYYEMLGHFECHLHHNVTEIGSDYNSPGLAQFSQSNDIKTRVKLLKSRCCVKNTLNYIIILSKLDIDPKLDFKG